jgi:flagellar M-ring protein FliF
VKRGKPRSTRLIEGAGRILKALVEGRRAFGPAPLARTGAVAIGMLALLVPAAAPNRWHCSMRSRSARFRPGGRSAHPPAHPLPRRRQRQPAAGCGQPVPRARLSLAEEGLAAGGSIGYEICDRGGGLAATDFQRQISETRALEATLVPRHRWRSRCAFIWCCRARRRLLARRRKPRPA